MQIIVVLTLLLAALVVYGALAKTPFSIKSHWQTFLDGVQISSNEFYTLVKNGLEERKISNIYVGEETFMETHFLSTKRAYLRIKQYEYIIFICAAPYGTGTFVSSWLCTEDERLLNRIPILNKLAGKDRNNKTFYQMDTQAMFRQAVHAVVLAAVDSLTETKGKRGLAELERQLTYVN